MEDENRGLSLGPIYAAYRQTVNTIKLLLEVQFKKLILLCWRALSSQFLSESERSRLVYLLPNISQSQSFVSSWKVFGSGDAQVARLPACEASQGLKVDTCRGSFSRVYYGFHKCMLQLQLLYYNITWCCTTTIALQPMYCRVCCT